METKNMIDILYYREFYDVPRSFIIPMKNGHNYVLLESLFSEEIDDYNEIYDAWEISLPENISEDNWACLDSHKIRSLGNVPVDKIKFDRSKRKSVEEQIYCYLLKIWRWHWKKLFKEHRYYNENDYYNF